MRVYSIAQALVMVLVYQLDICMDRDQWGVQSLGRRHVTPSSSHMTWQRWRKMRRVNGRRCWSNPLGQEEADMYVSKYS